MYKYLATTLTSPRSTQSALDNSFSCELSNSFIFDLIKERTAMLETYNCLYTLYV